jgi:hypothetical protein
VKSSAEEHEQQFMIVRLTSFINCDTVAEWLRRSTRNRLGLSRVGSSPASVDFLLLSTFADVIFAPSPFLSYLHP